jgi:hypothetical protein
MGLETKGFEKGLMEAMDSPGGDTGSGMNEYFHEVDDTHIVDFDSWDFGMASRWNKGKSTCTCRA